VEFFKNIKPFTIILFAVILLLFILTDFVFFAAGFDYSLIWKLIDLLFFSGFLALTIPSIKTSIYSKVISTSKFAWKFYDNTKFLFYLLLFFLAYFCAYFVINFFVGSNYLKLFDKEIHLVFFIVISFSLVISQLVWLSNMKRKGTKNLIFRFLIFIVFFTIVMLINFFFFPELEQYENAKIIDTFFSLLGVVLIFFGFRIKNWIAISSPYIIKRLILYSIFMIVSFIIILNLDYQTQKGLYLSNFMFFHLTKVMSAIFLFNYLRVFYLSAISLPLAKIVEQKVYEVNSLSYLTKVARNFNKLEDICNVITELSYNSMNRSPSILIFNEGNSFEIKSVYGFELSSNDKEIYAFLKNINFGEIKTSIIYNSLDSLENVRFSNSSHSLPFQSICILPIFVRDRLFGNLIVGNSSEQFFDEDDLNLLSSFVETLSVAIENHFLINDTIEKEKYLKELRIAREIQLSFLPKELPKTDLIEISSFIQPSEEVGGDFYDFIKISDSRLIVLIGDVSGKGLGAAFYMALLKGIFFSLSKNIETAKDFLIKVNSSLFYKIDRQIHITITALLLDFEKGEVEVVRAGHLPMLVNSGNTTSVVKTSGIGISLVKTSFFAKKLESQILTIANGDYLILFTDGLVEILGRRDINNGIEKLKQIVQNEVYNNPKELVEKVIEDVKRNGTNFDDDATLLVLKVKNLSLTKVNNYDREAINQ